MARKGRNRNKNKSMKDTKDTPGERTSQSTALVKTAAGTTSSKGAPSSKGANDTGRTYYKYYPKMPRCGTKTTFVGDVHARVAAEHAEGTCARIFTDLVQVIGQRDVEVAAHILSKIGGLGCETQFDSHGNLWVFAPGFEQSATMFTAHMDTVARQQTTQKPIVLVDRRGDVWAISGGDHILGADDRTGVAILIYMIQKGVPGTYVFFTDEERGRIGSEAAASDMRAEAKRGATVPYSRCVSFDRKGYSSVITDQIGNTASDTFAHALAEQLNAAGMDLFDGFKPDPTGVYTDSKSFEDVIPECTNVSVGYFDQHSEDEAQNLTFLNRLSEALLTVSWETLPTVRTPRKTSYSYGFGYGRSGSFNDGWVLGRDGTWRYDPSFDDSRWSKSSGSASGGAAKDKRVRSDIGHNARSWWTGAEVRFTIKQALEKTPIAFSELLADYPELMDEIDALVSEDPWGEHRTDHGYSAKGAARLVSTDVDDEEDVAAQVAALSDMGKGLTPAEAEAIARVFGEDPAPDAL